MGEGEGGMIWEKSTETCILPYEKQIATASSMHEVGQSWCSGTTQRDGVAREVGRGFRMGGYVHVWLIHVK